MVLTKLEDYDGNYVYVNLESVVEVCVTNEYYRLHYPNKGTKRISLTETNISDLVDAADTAYGA